MRDKLIKNTTVIIGLLWALAWGSPFVFGQSYFSVVVGDAISTENTNTILETPGAYITVGNRIEFSQPTCLDLEMIRHTKDFSSYTSTTFGGCDEYHYVGEQTLLYDHLVFVPGTIDSIAGVGQTNHGILAKLDTSGQFIDKYYPLGDTSSFLSGICRGWNNELILTGMEEAGGHDQLLLIAVDTTGQVLWKKSHGGSGNEFGYTVERFGTNQYLVSGYTNSFGNGMEDAWILITDDQGNIQDNVTAGGSRTDKLTCKEAPDGSIVCVGFYNNLLWPDSWWVHFNNSLVVIDSTVIPFEAGNDIFDDIIPAPDGGWMIAGSFTEQNTQIIHSVLAKLSATGELEWTRVYKARDTQNYLPAIHEIDPNTYLMAGFVYPDSLTTQDLWFVQVDSLGCIIPNCFVGVEEMPIDQLEVSLFPNPNEGVFTVQFNGSDQEATLHLFNLNGQLLHSERLRQPGQEIDLSHIPAGVYLLEVMGQHSVCTKRVLIR